MRIVLTRRGATIAALAATALLAVSALAAQAAETFPSKPVRLIVPYAAGGGTDLLARVVGHQLATVWGQQVVIDNRAGAGGRVATELLVRAAPDGYTLLLVSAAHAINAGMYHDLPYDSVADVTPVGLWTTAPYVLVVNAKGPIASIPDLIAAAKRSPGRLTYSSSGNGSGPHLGGELFKMLAGIDMVHVPYKGGGPEMSALLAGETAMSFASIASARPLLQSGDLKALGVTTTARARGLPDVPPIAEVLPGYEASGWLGIGAPKGTPADVIERLNKAFNEAIVDPAVKSRLNSLGDAVAPKTSADFGLLMKNDVEKWAKVIQSANIKLEQ